MCVTLCRGLALGAGVEGTFTQAVVSLFAFAGLGLVVGMIAQTAVDEAVRSKFEAQLAESGGTQT